MMNKNTFQELEELILPVLKTKNVPFIQGKPGVGKSTLAKKVADKFELLLIDIRLSTFDPTMFNGFLWFDGDRAGFKTLDLFPIEGDELPINPKTNKPYKGWLILLDEFTQVPKPMEGAAFQLILDRKVGTKNLHDKAFCMCAGNPVGQGMIAKPISTPMRSRLIHYELENTVPSFTPTMIEIGFHSTIVNYINCYPDMINNFESNHSNLDGTYACERSWEMLSDILNEIEKKTKVEQKHLSTLIGAVGVTAGNGIYTFLQNYYASPNIKTIVQDPENLPIPSSMQEQYACISYILENTTLTNGKHIATYLKRFPEEFQLIFGRILLSKNEELFDAEFKFLMQLVVKYAI